MPAARGGDDSPIEELVDRLGDREARDLLASAAEAHEDVMRALSLAAADDGDRLAVLTEAVDQGLRTRRHLDYWASSSWANDAAPVVDALAAEVERNPTRDLVLLLQRAAGHLVKVILRADDSNGMIGDLARGVLDLHRRACATGVADPAALAKWMIRFWFDDQDFFAIDPVDYADALGEKGMAIYKREVAKRSGPASPPKLAPGGFDRERGFPSFASRYANERLAVVDRDVDRIIDLYGGDQSSPHQFTQVAEAMVEIGRLDDALAWARRGIDETSGWQVANLYGLAVDLVIQRGDLDEAVSLRRQHHERMPSATTYANLQAVARTNATWDDEVDSARAVLAAGHASAYIDALLADDEPDAAWAVAAAGDVELHSSQWFRLAEAREPTAPADAMVVYLRLADESLGTADKRAYRDAIRRLKLARRAAAAAGLEGEFEAHVALLREQHRRRPTLIAMLDKAGL